MIEVINQIENLRFFPKNAEDNEKKVFYSSIETLKIMNDTEFSLKKNEMASFAHTLFFVLLSNLNI